MYWLIGWIVSYQLDRIISAGFVSYRLDRIRKHWFYALAGYWLDGADGLDGKLVGQGWDGPTLAGAGTGAPPLALEGQRAVGSGGWHQLRRC